MTEIHCAALMVLTSLWTLSRADAEVSCVFMESCILPCRFQAGSEEVIHWIWMPGNLHVHSFYHNEDQLGYQDQIFRNRTSLFKDQISRGNASLQLTEVQVQDQGRYKCYTSTIRGNKESFINLKVDAPVSKINIQQVENRITCSSEGIYPEPELTWSTNPPSTFKNTTRVQQTEQQLYNISSSLILSDNVTDVDYSCSISTRRNTRRATLLKPRAAPNVGVILGVVVAVLVLAAAAAAVVGVVLYRKHKGSDQQRRNQSESNVNSQELHHLTNDTNTQQQESNTDSVDAAQS